MTYLEQIKSLNDAIDAMRALGNNYHNNTQSHPGNWETCRHVTCLDAYNAMELLRNMRALLRNELKSEVISNPPAGVDPFDKSFDQQYELARQIGEARLGTEMRRWVNFQSNELRYNSKPEGTYIHEQDAPSMTELAQLQAENARLLAMVRRENREKGESFNEWWRCYRMALYSQNGGEVNSAIARRIWDAAYELARSRQIDKDDTK